MKAFLLTAVLVLLTYPALACEKHHMAGMEMTSKDMSGHETADDVFAQSRMDMHKNMNVKPSGDTDLDFVNNMIPHHQGAVDMAKVELEHGKNPELRKLAEDIIKAQEAEIRMMETWKAKLAAPAR